MSVRIQYIVVRSDLKSALNWPLGAIIAQCCHAVSAVMHLYPEDDDAKAYINDLDNMHKVVLEVSDEMNTMAFEWNFQNFQNFWY